ncbi:hypothetical protein IC575_025033 [Cucumis melo]
MEWSIKRRLKRRFVILVNVVTQRHGVMRRTYVRNRGESSFWVLRNLDEEGNAIEAEISFSHLCLLILKFY